jgi:hypothetical protein
MADIILDDETAGGRNGHMEDSSSPAELSFHLIKGNFFRVIHVDGAFGGITPRLDIRMAIFNERHPIPKVMVHHVTPEGGLGEEITERRVTKEGVVREVEADLIMDYGTAKAIHEWLGKKIEAIEERIKETTEEKNTK